jgi:hypothetical protein
MRIVFAAFLLCAIAFAAGIAGDLSLAAQPPPAPVARVSLPPETVRAHPLPVRAAAVRAHRHHRQTFIALAQKPRAHTKAAPKVDPLLAMKRGAQRLV